MSEIRDGESAAPSDRVKYATFGKRLVAYIIDLIVVGTVSAVVGYIIGVIGLEAIASMMGIVVGIAYYGHFWTSTGATPGKSIMMLKVVDGNGNLISWGGAILRYVGYIISGIVLALGFIWIIFDKKNQGWHDKIAGTFVIDEGE